MAIQNVIQHANLDGGLGMSILQANFQGNREVSQIVAAKMYDNNENFENLGQGQFTQSSRETMEVSVESIARIMEQDDDYGEVSNFGNEPTFTSGFQQNNDFSYQTQQQIAANAYKYFDVG